MNRLKALIIKEYKQMFRDVSNILLGIVVPFVLIIIFGYGLSLDIKNINMAIVKDENSEAVNNIISIFDLSSFYTIYLVNHFEDAEKLLKDYKVDAIMQFSQNFQKEPKIQLIVNGVDSNYARMVQNYTKGALMQNKMNSMKQTGAQLNVRFWFNDAQKSKYSLIPGLIVLIMTLIGALLTSLVMAREWERGTLESLFATPVSSIEILTGKILPYFSLGMLGFIMCLLAAKFLFGIPFVGSILILIFCSALYLIVSLGIGLTISSITKSQLLASQIVLVVTFLPSLMLSGFLFDLNSAPFIIYIIAHMMPATWYVELLQTILLTGNVALVIVRDSLILSGFALLFMLITLKVTRKSLDN